MSPADYQKLQRLADLIDAGIITFKQAADCYQVQVAYDKLVSETLGNKYDPNTAYTVSIPVTGTKAYTPATPKLQLRGLAAWFPATTPAPPMFNLPPKGFLDIFPEIDGYERASDVEVIQEHGQTIYTTFYKDLRHGGRALAAHVIDLYLVDSVTGNPDLLTLKQALERHRNASTKAVAPPTVDLSRYSANTPCRQCGAVGYQGWSSFECSNPSCK